MVEENVTCVFYIHIYNVLGIIITHFKCYFLEEDTGDYFHHSLLTVLKQDRNTNYNGISNR